ncbi:g6461 [Coccomyxa viridis]|uniref:NADPH--hemoprotein reductase n=1 Tax=Coccomyxa viridis TaxID=1274662 RepID=A0ABP1G1Z5_9CHLO
MRAETLIILIMATYGDGEPTDDAAEFCQWLTTKSSDNAVVEQLLQALPFAVFALGSKKYEHFCAAGKLAYQCMIDLGARPVVERGDGNDDEDMDADFEAWKASLLSAIDASGLLTTRAEGEGAGNSAHADTHETLSAYDVIIPDEDTHVRTKVAELFHNFGNGTRRYVPFLAVVLTVKELHAPSAERSCIHVELDITGSNIMYTAGDHLGVFSKNGQDTVERAAKALGCSLGMAFTLVQPVQAPVHLPQPFPGPVTVADALAWHVDLLSPVSKPALQGLLALANGEDRGKLERLLNGSAEQYKAWHKQSRCLLEVLEEFPTIQPPLGAFFASVAQKLQPRFYSISSSPAADPNVVSLTVAVVQGFTPTGRLHKGLSSTYLKDKLPGTRVPVFLRQSSFRLPSDTMVPLLMVGAGTGLAPYRGFLQERKVFLDRDLFFGCRNRNQDFIYKSELEDFQEAGALTELHVAFSREGKEKEYVQHQLLRQAQTVAHMLSTAKDARGVAYVCGDAKHMAQDVAQTAVSIVMTAEGCSEEIVRARFASLSKERRIQKDVWCRLRKAIWWETRKRAGRIDVGRDLNRSFSLQSRKSKSLEKAQGAQSVGQYMVGDILTTMETMLSWTGVAILFFVVLVPATNQTILAYFTAELKQDCGLTIAQYGLLSGYANGLVYAFSSLILGWCVDHLHWPRTWLLVAANLLLAGMFVLEGLATNFGMLLAAVMIAAVGGSVHVTMSVSLVSDLLPPKHVSLGQALIFTGEAIAVVLAGNLSSAFQKNNISWRAAPLGLAVTAFVVAIAIAVFIREPKKGRFVVQAEECKKDFNLKEALAYLANMRTFWKITIGLGIRMNAGIIVLGFMPPFQALLFPDKDSLDATFATLVGVCAFASSVIIGAICERNINKRPWMALYAGGFGGLIGCFFFLMALWASSISKQHGGYALMLFCMGAGALFANGASGPLAALLTLLLPPEIKSFLLSVHEFATYLIGPMFGVIMGVGLQAIAARNERMYLDVSAVGTGPSSKLAANKRTFVAARVMMASGLIVAFVGGAIFFLWASWGVRHDIGKHKRRADCMAEPELVPRLRRTLLWLGTAFLLFLVLFLLLISLIASFNPSALNSKRS